MNKILVPTDFSDNAGNALNYAIEIAKRTNGSLVLLHSIPSEKTNDDRDKASLLRHSEIYLKKSAEKIKHAGDIKYQLHISEGKVIDSVLEACKKYDINLVVMGTKGESNLSSVIFGSNTANVINLAEWPVIAVPQGASISDIKKITYATDYRNSDIGTLKRLMPLAAPHHAQVDILHIAPEKQNPKQEVELMHSFMDRINAEINYSNLSFQLKNGEVNEVLKNYLEQGGCDMLVLSTHQRNWWNRLFDKSITAEMVHNNTTPVLVFHYNKHAELKLI